MTKEEQQAVLARYAAGEIGTRRAIEAAGFRDYADLVIALSQGDLPFPKPRPTSVHEAHLARAREILQPRLRHGS